MKNNNVFKFDIQYPTGTFPNHREVIRDDLKYIQERVQTYRALNARFLDITGGKYYESMLTMVTALDYIISGIGLFRPASCSVCIDPDQHATLNMIGTGTMDDSFRSEDGTCHEFTCTIPICIEMMYTQHEVPGNPAGVYSIDISPVQDIPCVGSDGVTRVIPSMLVQIGSARIVDMFDEQPEDYIPNLGYGAFYETHVFKSGSVHENINPDEILCIPANPNDALRYCENFPTPSCMMELAGIAFEEIYHNIACRNNEGDANDERNISEEM